MDDKIIHMLTSLLLVLGIRVLTNPIMISNNLIYLFIIIVGMTKELIDLGDGGKIQESIMDMAANLIGVIIGMIIIE